MILLDTHVWVWWVHGDPIPFELRQAIELREDEGFAVSAISCWEVAKLVEYGRLELPTDLSSWLNLALKESGVSLIPLTPRIAAESTRLPGDFHRDPADQIIVATARIHDLPLATCDEKIRAYPYIQLLTQDQWIQDS
ncbi:MAG TPA: type II toxin-antitoxin system VapC family toxin [Thermoanaerobaculia bacterium]|nr:type II toxin-antitoxin system VapC family toxin [Thermoanaerobaculia bacterium]